MFRFFLTVTILLCSIQEWHQTWGSCVNSGLSQTIPTEIENAGPDEVGKFTASVSEWWRDPSEWVNEGFG
jgi:hypothetical protein